MQFGRLKKIISEDDFLKIENAKVVLIGVGGVGGAVLEGLVRSGIKNIKIIDNDNVDITNLNRQIITNMDNIGLKKVDVAEKRAKSINPECNITALATFLTKNNLEILNDYDYIIDACDTITTKKDIIKYAFNNNRKLITCLGTGNRFDPTKLKITTLDKTMNDPVAKVMRKIVKEEHINLKKCVVVASDELPQKISDRVPGSTPFVPNAAGLIIASYVINDLIHKTTF